MTICIDIRRVLTLSLFGTILVFGLGLTTGCGAGFANNRSKSTYEVDDGVNPVRRVTSTHEGSANGASVGLPLLGFAGSYGTAGYGQPLVGGGNLCAVHPDYCGETVTVMAPAMGGSGDLENRVASNERKIGALGGSYREMITEGRKTKARVAGVEKKLDVVIKVAGRSYRLDRAQCLYLQANPGILSDAKVQEKANEACNEILGAAIATEEGE